MRGWKGMVGGVMTPPYGEGGSLGVRRGTGGRPMGSDPTAACGGNREGSDWQRSARDEGASALRIFAGYRNRIIPTGVGGICGYEK